MTKHKMTFDEFQDFMDEKFPVRQARHTGQYGWERYGDCLDLSRCVFATEEKARKDRDLTLMNSHRDELTADAIERIERSAKRKMTRVEFQEFLEDDYPVCQAFHTGLYGWERYGGCLDLSSCKFETEEEAIINRDVSLYEDYRDELTNEAIKSIENDISYSSDEEYDDFYDDDDDEYDGDDDFEEDDEYNQE